MSPRYGDDRRPVKPGRPSYRSEVRKLGGTGAEYNVPGPGTYTPQLVGKERASSWVMGDRNARKSAVDAAGESPGPVRALAAAPCRLAWQAPAHERGGRAARDRNARFPAGGESCAGAARDLYLRI